MTRRRSMQRHSWGNGGSRTRQVRDVRRDDRRGGYRRLVLSCHGRRRRRLLPELHRLALRIHRHWRQLASRGNESRGARGMGAMKSQRLLRRAAHRTRRHRHRRAQNPLSGGWSGLVGEIVSLGILVRTSRPASIHHTSRLLQRVIVHRDSSANLQLLLLTGRLSHSTPILLRHIRTTSRVIQRRYSMQRRFGGPSYLPLCCARRRSRARRRPRYRAPIVLAICLFLVITGSSGTRMLSLRLFPCPAHVLELSWSALLSMPLHGDMSIEMIESSISFCTSWKVARV